MSSASTFLVPGPDNTPGVVGLQRVAVRDVRFSDAFARCVMGGVIVVEVRDRSREDAIMYDERPDLGHAAGVLARGVLWLGAAEGAVVQDRTDASLYADRISSTALLGDAHGPRLLELLDVACG